MRALVLQHGKHRNVAFYASAVNGPLHQIVLFFIVEESTTKTEFQGCDLISVKSEQMVPSEDNTLRAKHSAIVAKVDVGAKVLKGYRQ